jgi:hypothetical protein
MIHHYCFISREQNDERIGHLAVGVHLIYGQGDYIIDENNVCCGNGIVDEIPGEQCDDGNIFPYDYTGVSDPCEHGSNRTYDIYDTSYFDESAITFNNAPNVSDLQNSFNIHSCKYFFICFYAFIMI